MTVTEAPEAAAPSTDLEPAPPALTDADLERVAELADAIGRVPDVPSGDEVRQLASLAVIATAAGNVPKPLRGKPNDAFMVMLEGRALGMAPTTALRMLHVIDGTVTVPPKVKLALIRQRGLGEVWPEPGNNATGATWHARRDGRVTSYTFTWADAQAAGLIEWGCDPGQHRRGTKGYSCTCKDNWRSYGARMVSWRALGYLLDDVFPDVGTGLYAADELGAVTDEDGNPLDVTSWETPAGLTRPAAAVPAAPVPMADDATVAGLWLRVQRLMVLAGDEVPVLKGWWKDAGHPPLEPGRLPERLVQVVGARLTMHERKVDAAELERWEGELAVLAGDVVPVDEFDVGDSDEPAAVTADGALCAGCTFTIGEADDALELDGLRYHTGCEPFT